MALSGSYKFGGHSHKINYNSTMSSSFKNLSPRKDHEDSPGPLNSAKLAELHKQYSSKNNLISDYLLAT